MCQLPNWHSAPVARQFFLYNTYITKRERPLTLMTDPTVNELTVTKSLRLLTNGFKSEFATFAYADPRMTELLMELASEFVDANIPIIEEDNQTELALMLMETLDLITR
jgi:hypothetical protein